MVEQIWNDPQIYRIRVDLPDNPLRWLNVYVLRSGGRSLVVDTGFNRPECRQSLWRGLEELGLDLENTALFLTHLHSDHVGLVWDFVERKIPVYMGRREHNFYDGLVRRTEGMPLDEQFAAEGFPPEQLALQATGNQGRAYAPRPGFPVCDVEDGEVLSLGEIPVKAICTPGHTPGHMVLYLPEQQILFSGDHVLFDITPNISVWPGVDHPLEDYLASLRSIRSLPVRLTLPAHRGGGEGLEERVDQLLDHHRQRLEEIQAAVAARPGSTAYEIAGRISWSARGLGWAQFPPHQRWFAMGETLAHLHLLADRGQLAGREEEGVIRYEPLPASAPTSAAGQEGLS